MQSKPWDDDMNGNYLGNDHRQASKQARKRNRAKPRLKKRLSYLIMARKKEIEKSLNVQECLGEALHPRLSFLNSQELDELWKLCEQERHGFAAVRMLHFLNRKPAGKKKEKDFYKFIACVSEASSHRGHLELCKVFHFKLNEKHLHKLDTLLEEIHGSPLPSPYRTPRCSVSPERPLPLIDLQGIIVEAEFVEVERKLWDSFSRGKYDELESSVNAMQKLYSIDGEDEMTDCLVVAMWFQSLIFMHRD